MSGKFLILALLLSFPTAVAAQCPEYDAADASPGAVVRYLAHDELQGRLAGSPGERCAADFIAAHFRALGLQPAGADSYFQDVPLASVLNPHAAGTTGRNVLALLPGSDPALRDEIIVVGAHYDHLGTGTAGSLAATAGDIHNGADDNASGVAGLIAVAAQLIPAAPRRTILFAAFTGEESGLLGSGYFVRSDSTAAGRMKGMLNMDMIGRLEGRPLIVYGVDTAEEWRDIVGPAARLRRLPLALHGEGYGPSDHASFYGGGIPALHFFSNTHSDYHKPSDDWEKIDVAGLEQISALVADVADHLASRPDMLRLVRGAGTPPQPAAAPSGRAAAWLGTIPDFTPVPRGVLLGGVSPGSPAETAGLRQGDVLVGLGGREVADLQAMTDALRAHAPGDEVEIVVLRAGTRVVLHATLGSRANR